jgi:hypothetical protein
MLPSPDMHVNWQEWARALVQALTFENAQEHLQPFVVARLPAAARAKYMLVYCTDTVPPQPVFSDGIAWRKVTDGTIV